MRAHDLCHIYVKEKNNPKRLNFFFNYEAWFLTFVTLYPLRNRWQERTYVCNSKYKAEICNFFREIIWRRKPFNSLWGKYYDIYLEKWFYEVTSCKTCITNRHIMEKFRFLFGNFKKRKNEKKIYRFQRRNYKMKILRKCFSPPLNPYQDNIFLLPF